MMRLVLPQNYDAGSIDLILISIPESMGILAFGIGLIGAAVLVRWLLAGDASK